MSNHYVNDITLQNGLVTAITLQSIQASDISGALGFTPGPGTITGVTNSDSSLTFTTAAGVVTGSLNTANPNNWTGQQTFQTTSSNPLVVAQSGGSNNQWLYAYFTGGKTVVLDNRAGQNGEIFQWLNQGNKGFSIDWNSGNAATFLWNSNGTYRYLMTDASGGSFGAYTGSCAYALNAGGIVAWSSGALDLINSGSFDTAVGRVTGGVVGASDAQGNPGWFQNTAGLFRVGTQQTNNSASPQAITWAGSKQPTVKGGRSYVCKLVLLALNTVNTEGFSVNFNSGSATLSNFYAGFCGTPAGCTVSGNSAISSRLNNLALSTMPSTGTGLVVIEIDLVITCATGGTILPQFSENTSSSGTATVEIGSFFFLEDCPN